MSTILVAEDEPNVRLLLEHHLKPKYEVLSAEDGLAALAIVESKKVDLLVADISMPRMDGYELVQSLRRRGYMIPVMMLTANQTFDARREGFRAGIDDYLTKPVNYEELGWRIKALLRRSGAVVEERIRAGGILVDSATYSISREGTVITLPKKEFELLFRLLSSPGRIFTKEQLLADIWGYDSESGEETLKTHISRLRSNIKNFGEIEIIAVKGVGYHATVREGPGDE